MGQKILGSKKFRFKKAVWVKNLGKTKILGQKSFLGQKNIGSKKIWVIKIFERKKCWIRDFFLFKKKQVGLTQGGGYMTPLPESGRVKIVLDCC